MQFYANHFDRFLCLPDLKPLTGMGRSLTYDKIKKGCFPRPVKLGRKSVWSEAEVRAWIEARKAERRAA
jgi:prophage regulatory protein